eukprot:scaffold5681_cov377-Prasinococcus_capsulatus_cf.AAC.8
MEGQNLNLCPDTTAACSVEDPRVTQPFGAVPASVQDDATTDEGSNAREVSWGRQDVANHLQLRPAPHHRIQDPNVLLALAARAPAEDVERPFNCSR